MRQILYLMAMASVPVFGLSAARAQVPQRVQEPAVVVQAQVDAFNKGDVEAFEALYAEDVELYDLGLETKPNLSGGAALRARYKPTLPKYNPQTTIVSRMQTGSFVIDKELTKAGGRASEGVAIYQALSGKIRRVWFAP